MRTRGKVAQLRMATDAMAGSGSNATMPTPRAAKATVALPVPAPTSSARTSSGLPSADSSTASTITSE